MGKFFYILTIALLLSACATGEKVRSQLQEGMPKQDIIAALGKPDGFQRVGDFESLTYKNRLVSGWSWDRADYTVILQNGRVIQWGAGEVRQNGPNTIILVPTQ